MNILKYAIQARAKKTIILSSTAVMGFGRTDMTENHPKRPACVHYIASKQRMEEQAMAYACANKIRMTILRPGDVYGEHDRTTTLKLFKALEEGSMGFINSGKAILAPLYVHNLIDAMLKAAETRHSDSRIYNITDGVRIDWNHYVGCACEYLDRPKPKLNVPYFLGYSVASILEALYGLFKSKEPPLLTRYRIIHGGLDYHFDITAAKKELGYRPSTDIKRNLKRTVEWYMSQKLRKTKVLITGVSGFWGFNIAGYLLSRKRKDLDVTGSYQTADPGIPGLKTEKIGLTDFKKIGSVMKRLQPNVIIHTAAVSRIGQCEKDPKKAMVVNFEAVKEIVRWANLYKSRLVFFSTDLVYTGNQKFKKESDPVQGLHVYEKSKILAEDYIRSNSYDYVILRTALSYGPPSPGHSCFLGWVAEALEKGDVVKLYDDQFRTPLSVFDGARIIERLMTGRHKNMTVNFGGHERISRYSLGVKFARIFGYDRKRIVPVRYDETDDPFKPAPEASLDTSRLRTLFGRTNTIDRNMVILKKVLSRQSPNRVVR